MHIYNSSPYQNRYSLINKEETKYKPYFCGNLSRGIKTIELGASELSNVSTIANHYNQLDIMFKTAGNYMADLFKKGIAFLIPLTAAGFVLKDTLKSEEVPNVKIEMNNQQENSEELISFTVGKDEDVVKLTVSKSGKVDVIADEDLSDVEVNKYLNEIMQNHDKLFENVLAQTKEAINSIGGILSENINYDFDLNSKTDMQRVVKQFIDEKKTISLLTKLIYLTKFMQNFEFEENMPHKIEEGELKDKDIYFSFSNLNNQFFDGMRVTAIDRKKNTVQGFVAFSDGNVYKSKEFPIINGRVPRVEWVVRKLFIMSPEDIEEKPEIKEMFQYAYSHTDKIYRGMMGTLHRIEKQAGEQYENASPKKKVMMERALKNKLNTIKEYSTWKSAVTSEMAERTSKIDSSQLDISHAKVIKVYNLSDETFNKVKKIDNFNDRISASYDMIAPYLKNLLTERLGITRRKYINGFIFDDMLSTKDMYLGVARYTFGVRRDEVINFGIFNKNFEEMARFKIMPDGSVRLMIKPTDSDEFCQKMEKMFDDELGKGLLDRLILRMDDMCYYHENITEVNKYIEKSGLTAYQAVKEIRNGKTYYQADTELIQKIKNNINEILQVYDAHNGPAYRWQKVFFTGDFDYKTRYMCDYIEQLDLIYEFAFTKNEVCPGLRIALKDKDGNFIRCYIVNYNGNVYRLAKNPSSDNPKYFYIDYPNLYQLSPSEVAADNLEIVMDTIYNNISTYKNFLQECSGILDSGRYKIMPNEVAQIAAKHKLNTEGLLDLPEKVSKPAVTKDSETGIAKRKPGRPRKNPVDTLHTPVAKDTPRKELSKIAKKPVKVVQPKPQTTKPAITKQEEIIPEIIQKPVELPDQQAVKTPFIKIQSDATKEKTTIVVKEEKNGIPTLVTINGVDIRLKPFMSLSMEDVVSKIKKIFETPYEERSPHLVHDLMSTDNIFLNRFSVKAPDEAWVTVSAIKSGPRSYYYSIRVQRENNIMYLNINPLTNRIYRCDSNNNIIRGDDGDRLTISKENYMVKYKKNPLFAFMSMYFDELFAQKPEAERTTVPFQVFKRQDTIAKQAMLDFERAMLREEQARIEKAMEAELAAEEAEEPEEPEAE